MAFPLRTRGARTELRLILYQASSWYGRYYSALSICGIYENRQAVCGNVESTLIPDQKRCISLGLQGPRNTNPLSNRPDCKRVLGRNWRNVNRANRSTTFEKADACNRKRWMVYVHMHTKTTSE